MNTYELIQHNKTTIKKAAAITRAIGHKLRQQMIQVLQDRGNATVTELYIALRMGQSECSQHLAVLRRAGIVKTVRHGKFIEYSVNEERVKEVLETLAQLN